MTENAYCCVFFKSDKTVSVIPKSRCILRDSFEVGGEVEVKWRIQGKQQVYIGKILQVSSKQNKHLLEEYSVQLHQYITSRVKDSIEFSVDDLIGLWTPNSTPALTNKQAPLPPDISSPAKKQRLDDQTQPKQKTKQKKKTIEKKSLESSANLAAQEIIGITQFNSVFPTSTQATVRSEDHSLSLIQSQQECPPAMVSQKQRIEKQQQTKRKPLQPIARRPIATNPVWYTHKKPPQSVNPVSPSLSVLSSSATASVSRNEQRNLNEACSVDLTYSPQARDNPMSNKEIYQTSTPVRNISHTPSASTGTVVRKALTILHDFDDSNDATIDLENYDCPSPDLNDSGILLDFEDDDWPMTEQKENEGELENLRQKVKMLEEENISLKKNLNASQFIMPSAEVIQYMRSVVELADGVTGEQLSEKETTSSYRVTANFKPVSEGDVRLIKGHDVFVPENQLRQVIGEAYTNGPQYLLRKLIPLVFSDEELANSCGQGIGITKQTDQEGKNPLDAEKIRVIKDYVLSFCVANNKTIPVAKQINEAFTQRVSYARRKRQRRHTKNHETEAGPQA